MSSNSQTLQEQLLDLGVENESLQSQMTTLAEEIQIHKSELARLKDANDELKNENNILIERNHFLTNYLKSYNELTETLDAMNSTNLNLNARISTFKKNMLHVENENKELSETVELFRQKTATNEVHNQIKKQQIGDHKQKISQLEQDIMLLHSQMIKSDESDEKTQQTLPIQSLQTTILPPLPDISDMETTIMKSRRSIDMKLVIPLDDIGIISRKARSNSPWSTQSGGSTVGLLEYERSVSSHNLYNIQEWSETPQTSISMQRHNYDDHEYQVLLRRLENVEKECEQLKKQLKNKSIAIKELRAKNTRLGKRLRRGRNSCYMFDIFK